MNNFSRKQPGSRESLSEAGEGAVPPVAGDGVAERRAERHELEGDYRPANDIVPPMEAKVDSIQFEFLMQLADALNTTLDLQTLMHRVANIVRAVIDFRIFAILLVNDRAKDLRMRFQIGHTPETERLRIKIGKGVVGQAADQREAILLNDVTSAANYINANPDVRSELAVPLITKNRVIGVIDIQSEQPNYFRPEHLNLLTVIASRVAVAIENARLYTRVARQAQTLQVLNEISRELTSILDPDQLLERVGQLLKRVIDYQMFTIWLLDDGGKMLENRFAMRFGEKVAEHSPPIAMPLGFVGTAATERRPIVIADVRKDPRYIQTNPETRSEMAVPLIYKGKVIGVLDLEHVRTHFFTEDHMHAVSTMAAQIAVAIENARLYQRIAHEEQRLERDLSMARKVQLRLLPPSVPVIDHAQFAARFLAARTIGGDIYDFIRYDEQTVAIAVGDVSGKAAPAALYAALVSGIMRSLAAQRLSPAALLASLNDALQERKLDEQYVTMLFAVWNDANQTLQIANAGSVQPIFWRGGEQAGEVDIIQAEGFPLGLFPNVTYEEFTLSTQPDDAIIFFSDGIVDAENSEGEMFGQERLSAVIGKCRRCTADSLVNTILKAVSDFQGGTEHFDDETVVVLRVLA